MPVTTPASTESASVQRAAYALRGPAAWLWGVLGGVLYALAIAASRGLHQPSSAMPVLWLPTGVALALWLCLGWRCLPGLLLGGLAGHGVLLLWTQLPSLASVSLGALALISAELLCMGLTARLLRELPHRLDQAPIRLASLFAALALMGAGACALLQGTVVWQLGLLDAFPAWRTRLDLLGSLWLAQVAALLLVTPPLLILLSPALRQRSISLLAFPMQSTGLGLTVLAVAVTGQMQFDAQVQDFRGQVRALGMALQNHVDMALRDLEVIRAFHYKVEIDQSEFHAVADPMLEQSPWQRHFAWLPRIQHEERDLFEDSPLGLDRRSIREVDSQGALVRSPRHPDYFPVRWTEPAAGHEALIGVDESSDSVRGPALRQAVLTGRITATPPYSSLERAATDLSVVTLYAPVLTGDLRQTHGHDPAQVRGMVSATLDLGELIRLSSQQMELEGIDLLLHDPASARSAGVQAQLTSQLRHIATWLPDQAPMPFTPLRDARQTIAVADRHWTLQARPARLSPTLWPSPLQWAVLCCGLAFTALLTGFVQTRLRHERALQAINDGLEDQVHARTQELATTNGQLQAEVEERRRLEDDLRLASQQAQQASQAKSVFLANMSHEIRTPLNAVIGYTQILLEDQQLAGKARERLRIILQAGQRLLRLINDVLDLSKIEAGGLQLHPERFDLCRELTDAATLFDQRAQAKGLTLQLDLALEAPSFVCTDRTKLGQIVLNLLGNAVKFTEHGQVSLSAHRDGDEVLIDVRDHGPGISAAELAQLFAPFRQGQAGHEKGGTGLGLALSRHIARSMGGELSISSAPGQGTHAHLRLPLPAATADSAVPDDTEAPMRKLSPQTPLKVLVVDDDDDSRDILVQLLEGLGCQVQSARDGLAGLRAAQRGGFQIIFTDIRMPVLDGLQMLSQLRTSETAAQVPVVAVSASSLVHERRHYLERGFSDFVGKPYTFGQIHRMLAQHAGAHFVAAADAQEAATAKPPTAARAPCEPGPVTQAALASLIEAAGNGELRKVNALLDQFVERLALLDQPATPPATAHDALPPETLGNMQRAAQGYDFSALESQAREALDAARRRLAPSSTDTTS
jgi:signal transduction histidine kinase/FixJ family two-component response regulator